MKKLILLLSSTIIACSATKAQINKGTIMLGGDLSFSHSRNEGSLPSNENTSYSIGIYPGAGYFFANNFAAGINTGYGYYSSKSIHQDGPDQYQTSSISSSFPIAPFVRWYKMLGEKGAFFLQASGGIEYRMSENKTTYMGIKTSSEQEEQEISARLIPGFAYFISNKLALEATIGTLQYYSIKNDPKDFSSNSHFDLDLRMSSIHFGVKYYLRNKVS